MLLFNSSKSLHTLSFLKLFDAGAEKFSPIIAQWLFKEWGEETGIKLERFIQIIESYKHSSYIGFYAGHPVGFFTLSLTKTSSDVKLSNVFIEKNYRGLGFAHQVIQYAKTIAKHFGFQNLLLETSKPELNSLYKKHGAKPVVHYFSFMYSSHQPRRLATPVDGLRIKLDSFEVPTTVLKR